MATPTDPTTDPSTDPTPDDPTGPVEVPPITVYTPTQLDPPEPDPGPTTGERGGDGG